MAKKYTFEEFVQKVREVSDDTIDLSNFKYVNSTTKGVCKCKVCGHIWETRPDVLLRGHKCRQCHNQKLSANKRIPFMVINERVKNINPFLELQQETYVNTKHKCAVICKKCGHQWMVKVNDLLNGHGCPQCYSNRIQSKHKTKINRKNDEISEQEIINEKRRIKIKCEAFIQKSQNKFGDCFAYDKCFYKSQKDKVMLFCKKHQHWFTVYPKNHLKQKYGGCIKCYEEYIYQKGLDCKMTVEKWKEVCQRKYGGKYSYDLVIEINNFSIDKVLIICPHHGIFEIGAKAHYSDGTQCPKCTHRAHLSKEELIKEFREIHGMKYDYHYVIDKEYSRQEYIEIVCPTHGLFRQRIAEHLSKCGCPKCRSSHLEKEVMIYLEKNKIHYIYQAKFDWLGRQSLDFYLPKYNVAIECQGSQHFFDAKMFKNKTEYIKQLDLRKKELCENNNVNLIYYLNEKYLKYVENLNSKYFTFIDDLLCYIKTSKETVEEEVNDMMV